LGGLKGLTGLSLGLCFLCVFAQNNL